MGLCSYCGREDYLHKCKYCGYFYCSQHTLPESHGCFGLERYNQRKREKWKRAFSSIKHYKNNEEEILQNKSSSHTDSRNWLMKRGHHSYNFRGRLNYLIKIILFFIVSLIGLNIFYSNAQKLNQINFWIIKLGGVLVLISLFFVIKFGWKLIREIINIVKRIFK